MEQVVDVREIDLDELMNAKALLKKRFPDMINYYFEDAHTYFAGIERGLKDGSNDEIAKNAHPLKSSSSSLGLSGVSQVARILEEKAKGGEAIETLEALTEPLKEALAHAEPKLRALLDD